jgi:hypothetical protein
MGESDDQELKDIRQEEISRGAKQPKKAVNLARQRQIRKLGEMLVNQDCDRETYVQAIHDFGLQEQPDLYRELLALWRRKRGNY